jgi:glycosyltransferase involved in cell wall biosynthesis
VKILLDARMISNTGVGTYIRTLLTVFNKINEDILVYALVNPSDANRIDDGPNVKIIRAGMETPIYSVKEQFVVPYYYRKLKPDLVHYPNFNTSFCPGIPFVVTICDLIYYLYPNACPNRIGHLYARIMMKHSVKNSKAVITISRYSKDDIVRHLKTPEQKINIIYIGIDQAYHPVEDATSVLRKYHLPQRYILYMGNHEPRKNLAGLLKAYAMSKSRNDYALVIGGKKDHRRNSLYETVSQLDIVQNVIFTDHLDQKDLAALYSAAGLFVFPSLYEGFGLPPLEAMACGTPVVCSNAASLPEAVGDAAVQFDPQNIDQMANAMDSVLCSPSLQKELVQKGFEQTRRFCWEKTAAMTIELYKKILGHS